MFMKHVVLWTLSSLKIHLHTKRNFFLCLTPSFLQKVLGPILRLPETLLTFSTSAWQGCYLCLPDSEPGRGEILIISQGCYQADYPRDGEEDYPSVEHTGARLCDPPLPGWAGVAGEEVGHPGPEGEVGMADYHHPHPGGGGGPHHHQHSQHGGDQLYQHTDLQHHEVGLDVDDPVLLTSQALGLASKLHKGVILACHPGSKLQGQDSSLLLKYCQAQHNTSLIPNIVKIKLETFDPTDNLSLVLFSISWQK